MTPAISASIVGVSVGPIAHTVDARWLMAYAAGIGETDPRFFDTVAGDGPQAHPVFPVCYEWPVALAIREKAIHPALASFGVHASHHLVAHRPPRANESLSTTARVIEVSRRNAGTLVVTRFSTLDERGAPVTTTDYGSVYRGVACDSERSAERPDALRSSERGDQSPDPGSSDDRWPDRSIEAIDVPAGAAHVYSECARIWNPIHTDRAVATAAGLPGLILHGTATLALAVSRVVARTLAGDPTRVRALGARFTGMVLMPSRLSVCSRQSRRDRVEFEVLDPRGARVLTGGWLTFSE
jgi:acyl dehydratase